MLYNAQNTASQYRTTVLTTILGACSDQHMKLESHVDQSKIPSNFTWNIFKCILNETIKPSFRLKIFNVYISPKIDYGIVLWYNKNPSPLNGLSWNAVRDIIFSKYNRFYKHVTFAQLNFPSLNYLFRKLVQISDCCSLWSFFESTDYGWAYQCLSKFSPFFQP